MTMMPDISFVDDLSAQQMTWLELLKAALDRQRLMAVPPGVFESFQARRWLEGEPESCKLNGEGAFAAVRLLGKQEAERKAARRRK